LSPPGLRGDDHSDMAQSLRQIKQRIRSVQNTKKITKAMEMVAASKLKKYQALLGQTRAYADELNRMLGNLISSSASYQHPFFEVRESKKISAVLITSDSGLCGSYNFNLFSTANKFLVDRNESISFFSIGRQGTAYLKRQNQVTAGSLTTPKPDAMREIVRATIDHVKHVFLQHDADQVFMIYTDFISMGNYKPKVERLLPLEGNIGQEKSAESLDYILEPSLERILEEMIPHYLELKVERAVKGSLVSEQVSRMMAMRQATDNATEMIDTLTLQRNKARQASITKELLEVISGSKALHSQ